MKKSDQKKKTQQQKRQSARLNHKRRVEMNRQAQGMVGLVRTPLTELHAHRLQMEHDLANITKICTFFIAEVEKVDLSQVEPDVQQERDNLLSKLKQMRLDLDKLSRRLKKGGETLDETETLMMFQDVMTQLVNMQADVDEAYLNTSTFLQRFAPEPIPDESDPSADVIPVDAEEKSACSCSNPCPNCSCQGQQEPHPAPMDVHPYPLGCGETMPPDSTN